MADSTVRVRELREQTFRSPMMAELPSHSWGPRRSPLLCEGWMASGNQPTTRLRRAASLAYRMAHEKVVINDHELIVGCPDFSPLTDDEQKRAKEFLVIAQQCIPPAPGVYDHMALDYGKLIATGVNGLIAEVTERRDALDIRLPENTAKDEFYRGCLLELNALLGLAKRYADHARALARSASSERVGELEEIADILGRVPAQPAASFREALQSIHFYTFMLCGDYQLGRPDQFLIDLYRADVTAGRLTPRNAQELIDCFCLLYSSHHPKGSAVGFMLGGRDGCGRAVNNELTYLFLKSIAHTRMAYPGIGLCVSDETPEDLLDLATETLSKGYSHPAIFNDNAITRGLLALGVPERDVHDYVHSSCVEITLCGRSGCWVFHPNINLPKLLLAVMRDKSECGSMDEFMEAFEYELRTTVQVEVHEQRMWQLERSRNGGGSLLAACLVDDCLETARSIDEGGSRYNFIMPTFIGMATVVDSLAAIERLVFEEQGLTMAEFHRILMADLEGHQALRERIVNRLPHFGNNEPETDGLMQTVSGMAARSCEGLSSLHGDKAVPGMYSYLEHVRKGEQTPATPDGRRAHTAFSAAASPVQGRDISGTTAAILSSTCWNQLPFMGGVAINLTLQPEGAQTRENLKAIIKTLIARGGLQLQVSCVAKETLLAARDDPSSYRNLLVRIGGYSDYFTSLSPAVQDEIVARTAQRANLACDGDSAQASSRAASRTTP